MSRNLLFSLGGALLLSGCNPSQNPNSEPVQTYETLGEQLPSEVSEARFEEYEAFESKFMKPRNLTIWLPPGYDAERSEGYRVIYAHDGQNKFHAGHAYGGVEWGADETATTMITSGDVPPAIIVGIWNTDERWQEYAPQKVIELLSGDTSSEWLGPTLPTLKGDAYLRFIVEELKPFIDETYNTAPGVETTSILGSSMGGLISLYAIAEYPDTFSRAAAVSIHWPLTEPDGPMAQQADSAMQSYLATSGLDPAKHTIWFDNGTETLDAAYPPHAAAMESWFREAGWDTDEAQFRTYEGTDHSEGAWAARMDEILLFLLAN